MRQILSKTPVEPTDDRCNMAITAANCNSHYKTMTPFADPGFRSQASFF